MTTEHLFLPVSQLREGDIVINHGMRILIDGPVTITRTLGKMDLYRWPGLVLNADELCDEDADTYDSFIASCLRGTIWEDHIPHTRKDDWTIQSNDLQHWRVERKTDEDVDLSGQ